METRTLDIPIALPEDYEDCERCVERLKQSLLSIEGLNSVEVDRQSSSLRVTYDPSFISIERVEERARQIGVEITLKYTHAVFTLQGLDCPECALNVEKALRKTRGVIWASVSYATSILSVEYETAAVSPDDIKRRVRKSGYDIVEEEPPAPGITGGVEALPVRRNPRAILTGVSGLFLAAGFAASLLKTPPWLYSMFYAAALVTGGYHAARNGLYSLRSLALDTNFLMTVAAIGAVAMGDWLDGAMVLFLFSLGSTLESYTVDKTRRSIRSLVALFPRNAVVKRDGTEQLVSIDDIRVDEHVVVKPGERIAVDGQVTVGASTVDQSPITGESVPVEKSVGDLVYAGSINRHGSLEVRVSSLAQDNTLSRIIHLVEEAQAQKAPSQRFSEQFGRIYTPLVLATAVILTVVPPFLGGEFSVWFRKALILLVVSCPCALVISTPVAIVAAIGSAAKRGVLVKGGAYLEAMARISVVALDKTGTLTSGRLRVTDIIALSGLSEEEILKIAATVESRSEHPLAEATLECAQAGGVSPGKVTYFEAIPGKGARAVVNGQAQYIGNRRLLDDLKLDAPGGELLEQLANSGKTLMFVCVEDTIVGVIAAADTIRETSYEAIRDLWSAGVRKTVMLTGDHTATASAVAKDLGIDEVRAGLLPEEKVEVIKDLVRIYGRAAMVGDGVNDAPALAAATVGVAMGGAGAHAALESADIVLMADDLSKLPYTMRLSRNTLSVIRQNLVFATLVVLGLVSSALMGKLTLAGGVIGHEASAMIVIANAMRLLRTAER